MRSRSFDTRNAPTISRRSTAIGWRRAMVRIARSSISRCSASIVGSSRHDALRQRGVALGERIDRLGDLLFGEPAHLGDHAGEILQVAVEGLRGVFDHAMVTCPARQPNRPVM